MFHRSLCMGFEIVRLDLLCPCMWIVKAVLALIIYALCESLGRRIGIDTSVFFS